MPKTKTTESTKMTKNDGQKLQAEIEAAYINAVRALGGLPTNVRAAYLLVLQYHVDNPQLGDPADAILELASNTWGAVSFITATIRESGLSHDISKGTMQKLHSKGFIDEMNTKAGPAIKNVVLDRGPTSSGTIGDYLSTNGIVPARYSPKRK